MCNIYRFYTYGVATLKGSLVYTYIGLFSGIYGVDHSSAICIYLKLIHVGYMVLYHFTDKICGATPLQQSSLPISDLSHSDDDIKASGSLCKFLGTITTEVHGECFDAYTGSAGHVGLAVRRPGDLISQNVTKRSAVVVVPSFLVVVVPK